MHTIDLSMEKITKVEGSASLDLKVRDGKVTQVHFGIQDYKRFYTNAMAGKPIAALPQLLSRICGTCSNAHILCSLKACEDALKIEPTETTRLLRTLTSYGLMIRDHALHLYLFALPDLYNKDAFLDFDENDEEQHQLLHDGFDIKAAGNFLATLVAGRSIHATHPTIGGFLDFPDPAGIEEAIRKLEDIRPAVRRLVDVFLKCHFHLDRETKYMALVQKDRFGFLEGEVVSSIGERIAPRDFRAHLEQVVLPYSQASAYQYSGEPYLVGALARLNLAAGSLHPKTIKTLTPTLKLFPSTNIFHNNLAQAIEILHCVDDALEILQTAKFEQEPVITKKPAAGIGIGVIEAPRGTLYHLVEIDGKGTVVRGEVIVPTGQNQRNIEEDIKRKVEELLPETTKPEIEHEIEKIIRAYDPCMSCGAHFLKVKWSE
ncbi:MAG: nickel-dependent hydrogenase large subunit [bacterium]